ncbi:MAG: ribosomal-processing cysteine protease Prp [Lachnospiraceae bacterium]|nr:ribosomal-processing cysteine protease Prp [Lachnospiraceae bacterium]
MTRAVIERTGDGHYRSFFVSGHAGYAEEGEDIVCAGISAIVINTINCLEDLLHEPIGYEYDEESGDISCVFKKVPSQKASFLIDTMIHGLEWIRLTYGEEYLSYEIKEV